MSKLAVMVEKVGGGYVPIIQYTPGNEWQHAEARMLAKVLHAVAGVSAYEEWTDQ